MTEIIKLGNDQYLFRLFPGQELMNTLKEVAKELAKEYGVRSGKISGLGGGFTGIQIHLSKSEMLHGSSAEVAEYPGPAELLSLDGNITTDQDGNPVIHCHGTFAEGKEKKHNAFGGHMLAAKLRVEDGLTGEIYISGTKTQIIRKIEERSGLPLNLSSPGIAEGDQLRKENEELRKQVNDLQKQLIQAQTNFFEANKNANETIKLNEKLLAQQVQKPPAKPGA